MFFPTTCILGSDSTVTPGLITGRVFYGIGGGFSLFTLVVVMCLPFLFIHENRRQGKRQMTKGSWAFQQI